MDRDADFSFGDVITTVSCLDPKLKKFAGDLQNVHDFADDFEDWKYRMTVLAGGYGLEAGSWPS